jgi:hypothetical protein
MTSNDSYSIFAAKTGDIESLQQMMSSSDFQWSPHTTAVAAEYGYLEFLKFCHAHDCPWDHFTSCYAAMKGHFDCLTFAYEHGAPLPDFVSNAACLGGSLDCLKYACEKGCPVDIHTSRIAAEHSLECLEYLHSIQCPMDVYTAISAAKNFKLKCLRFALENGCSLKFEVCRSLNNHANNIDLDEHIWLRKQLFAIMEPTGVKMFMRVICKELYDKVQAKIEEIKLQKQFASIECSELPNELVNFIICEYF